MAALLGAAAQLGEQAASCRSPARPRSRRSPARRRRARRAPRRAAQLRLASDERLPEAAHRLPSISPASPSDPLVALSLEPGSRLRDAPDVQGVDRGEAEPSYSVNRLQGRNPMQQPSRTSPRESGSWSAAHRKTAILGWLAFVVVAVGLIGQRHRSRRDASPPPSRSPARPARPSGSSTTPGFSPTEEIVLIQSETLDRRRPGVQGADRRDRSDARRRPSTSRTSPRRSTATAAAISEDGHSAFVEFEVEGGDEERRNDNLEPSIDRGRRTCRHDHPEYTVGQFGGGSANKAINETLSATSARPGCSRCRSRC